MNGKHIGVFIVLWLLSTLYIIILYIYSNLGKKKPCYFSLSGIPFSFVWNLTVIVAFLTLSHPMHPQLPLLLTLWADLAVSDQSLSSLSPTSLEITRVLSTLCYPAHSLTDNTHLAKICAVLLRYSGIPIWFCRRKNNGKKWMNSEEYAPC